MSDKELPKLGAPKKILFWSLRSGLCDTGGFVYAVDTIVKRKCMRVKEGESWKWQIVDILNLMKFDYTVSIDQDILNEIGNDMSDISYE